MSNVVAETILAQLGGNKFVAMTGAKALLASADALQFKLPARFAKDGINAVRIVLDPSDTYTVSFYKMKGFDVNTVKELDMVYGDQLASVFKSVTGLDVSL